MPPRQGGSCHCRRFPRGVCRGAHRWQRLHDVAVVDVAGVGQHRGGREARQRLALCPEQHDVAGGHLGEVGQAPSHPCGRTRGRESRETQGICPGAQRGETICPRVHDEAAAQQEHQSLQSCTAPAVSEQRPPRWGHSDDGAWCQSPLGSHGPVYRPRPGEKLWQIKVCASRWGLLCARPRAGRL